MGKRFAKRRDGNHVEVVGAFRKLGWSVLDMADLGRGMPDIVIGDKSHGTFLVEIKNPKTQYGRRGLSARQREFCEQWNGLVNVVSSLDDVVELTRNLTKGTGRADGKGLNVTAVRTIEEALTL